MQLLCVLYTHVHVSIKQLQETLTHIRRVANVGHMQ